MNQHGFDSKSTLLLQDVHYCIILKGKDVQYTFRAEVAVQLHDLFLHIFI